MAVTVEGNVGNGNSGLAAEREAASGTGRMWTAHAHPLCRTKGTHAFAAVSIRSDAVTAWPRDRALLRVRLHPTISSLCCEPCCAIPAAMRRNTQALS